MSTQSLDQQRAQFAWKAVQGCSSEYCNLVKGAGSLIMANGLMPTLAFYESKKKDHHLVLSKHLRQWLSAQGKKPAPNFSEFMGQLHQFSSNDYRQYTEEALALIRWLRHFAAAVTINVEK